MSYIVSKIFTIPSSTNEFTTGRMESWTIVRDASFQNEKDAKKYIINQNRMQSELPRFLVDLPEDEHDIFIEKFCFTSNDYIHLRRYFLGELTKDMKQEIISNLQENGVTVI
jgi:hypothetical protein